MRYFVNYDLHAVAKAKEKPAPFNRKLRYGNSISEWTEVDKETYEKMYDIFYAEALTR